MSLILGIYSKKSSIDKEEIKDIIGDFSLKKERKLRTIYHDNMLFSAMESNNSIIADNEDKSLIILFSGSVYDFGGNAKLLAKKGHKFKNRKNPAEFLLHSYEEYGNSFLKGTNGTFTFAIYNKEKDEIILANDSFGIYPLFIYNNKNCLIFSTEYEPIAKYKKFDNELNYDAIAEYFAFGAVLGDKTFFKNISNLSPGSILTINKNKSILKQYDDLNIKILKNKNLDYHAEKISRYIKKAVQSRTTDPANIRCSLSGGADTRLILSNLAEKQRKLIEFSTTNTKPLKEGDDKDVIIAKLIAKELNLNLKVKARNPNKFNISFFDEKRLRQSPDKRILAGLHGGEFLGGDCFRCSPISLKNIKKEKIHKKLEEIFTNGFLGKISDPFVSLKKELRKIRAENREFLFNIHLFTRSFFTSAYSGSHDDFLAPYAFSTKFDSPFWDKNFLKALLSVPKEYLLNYRLYNLIYKNHYPELIRFPTNSPLSMQDNSCMSYMAEGLDKKTLKQQKHNKILKAYMKSRHTWDKNFYNKDYIKQKFKANKNYILWPTIEKFMFEKKNHLKMEANPLIKPVIKFILPKEKNNFVTGAFVKYLKSKQESYYKKDPTINSFMDFETWYRKFVFSHNNN